MIAAQSCAHCGRGDVGAAYPGGYGAVDSKPLCHPSGDDRPDCYVLVTIYRHPMPCDRCNPDGANSETVWLKEHYQPLDEKKTPSGIEELYSEISRLKGLLGEKR